MNEIIHLTASNCAQWLSCNVEPTALLLSSTPSSPSVLVEYLNLTNSNLLSSSRLSSLAHRRNGRRTRLLLENLPELERLVRSSSRKHLAVRAEAAVKDTRLMSRDLDVLDASRIAPDAKAVIREPTGGDNLLVVSAPPQASDLGIGGDVVDAGTGGSVPKVDLAIVGTTAGSQQV